MHTHYLRAMPNAANSLIERAHAVLKAEQKAIASIPIGNEIVDVINLILQCNGKVVTSGMGKAGIIAQKVAATFSSTGTPSVFLHPGEAQHGDLGMLGPTDVLIIFSNSGKTREALELVDLAERLYPGRVPVISITSNPESDLGKRSTLALSIGRVEEACSLGMAPTASTTAMLALGDTLCILAMDQRGFGREDFLKRHHGGYLGSQR